MKKRYTIAIIVLLIAVIIGLFLMNKSKVEYMDFKQARNQNKIIQVIGKPDKNYDSLNIHSSLFIFFMTDKIGNYQKVVYHGPKPMNFDLAEYVVVKGKFDEKNFVATEILTKCPTKYEKELNIQNKDTIKSQVINKENNILGS